MAGTLASALCLVGFALAAKLAHDEWLVQTITTAMRSPDASVRGQILEDFADTPPADLPLRAQAALAQMALNAAQVAQSPDLRQLYADRANTLVSQLRQSAPHATPTLILGAQWELQQHPFGADCTLTDTAPRALSDYAESYHTAPFLWREARWRIALGSLCWANLATTTRAHMIDEATWLTRFDGALRPEVEDLLGDSPAAVQYQLHMVEKSADAEGENGF